MNKPVPPRVTGILETCLYVEDLDRSARFYEEVLGLERMDVFEPQRLIPMIAPGPNLLLLFKRGASPDHDSTGHQHLAFSTAADDLDAWEQWLAAHGIAIEEKKRWERGGTSLYFRDPDGHLLELATPGVWPVY
ncbi:MAG: VOC family protein [Acidobacteria bacterium]|nr:VOC family protein [Acidobacteriota bacterium]